MAFASLRFIAGAQSAFAASMVGRAAARRSSCAGEPSEAIAAPASMPLASTTDARILFVMHDLRLSNAKGDSRTRAAQRDADEADHDWPVRISTSRWSAICDDAVPPGP